MAGELPKNVSPRRDLAGLVLLRCGKLTPAREVFEMAADPAKIDRLNHALYPSLAMLAGMQLDVFPPLADGSMTTADLATKLGVGAAKLDPLLHAWSLPNCSNSAMGVVLPIRPRRTISLSQFDAIDRRFCWRVEPDSTLKLRQRWGRRDYLPLRLRQCHWAGS